eukprot:9478992-Karenia_brevis.AAC.1
MTLALIGFQNSFEHAFNNLLNKVHVPYVGGGDSVMTKESLFINEANASGDNSESGTSVFKEADRPPQCVRARFWLRSGGRRDPE